MGQISKSLKHRFFNLTQFAFWASQEAENVLKGECQPSKHSFYRLMHVAFWPCLKAHYEFVAEYVRMFLHTIYTAQSQYVSTIHSLFLHYVRALRPRSAVDCHPLE